jgi:methionyl-tRNA formyltransferase
MRRVLLIGQGPTTRSALESLLPLFCVAGLVRSTSDAATAVAQRHGVPVLADASVTAIEEAVDDLEPDCVVVSSHDRILPARLLARCLFINVHYAPLPEYRGRAPVNWAIINHRPATAMTVHVLGAELDAGPILCQQHVPIGAHDTVTDLYDRLNQIQRARLGAAVERHLDGKPGVAQDNDAATYGCTRLPADGEIDWSRPTTDVYALVRALTDPFPGALTHIDARRLVIWRAAPVESPRRWAGRVPGRVAGRSAAEGWVDVLTGDGVLRLHTVELEQGRREAAAGVITSVRTTLGLRAADLLERVRELEARVQMAAAPQPDEGRARRAPGTGTLLRGAEPAPPTGMDHAGQLTD